MTPMAIRSAERRDDHTDGIVCAGNNVGVRNTENLTKQIDKNPACKQADHRTAGFQADTDCDGYDDQQQQKQ